MQERGNEKIVALHQRNLPRNAIGRTGHRLRMDPGALQEHPQRGGLPGKLDVRQRVDRLPDLDRAECRDRVGHVGDRVTVSRRLSPAQDRDRQPDVVLDRRHDLSGSGAVTLAESRCPLISGCKSRQDVEVGDRAGEIRSARDRGAAGGPPDLLTSPPALDPGVTRPRHSCRATMATKLSAMLGSNCEPRSSFRCSSAASVPTPRRYGRSLAMATKASQIAITLLSNGIASPCSAVRVSLAVPALMVTAHDPSRLGHRREAFEQLRPQDRVPVYQLPI